MKWWEAGLTDCLHCILNLQLLDFRRFLRPSFWGQIDKPLYGWVSCILDQSSRVRVQASFLITWLDAWNMMYLSPIFCFHCQCSLLQQATRVTKVTKVTNLLRGLLVVGQIQIQIQNAKRKEAARAKEIQYLLPSRACIPVRRRMNRYVLHTTSIPVRKAAAAQGNIVAQFQAAISSTLNRNTNENGILPKMCHWIRRNGLYSLWIMTLMQMYRWTPPGWERLDFIALSFVVGQATWHLQWSISFRTVLVLITRLANRGSRLSVLTSQIQIVRRWLNNGP